MRKCMYFHFSLIEEVWLRRVRFSRDQEIYGFLFQRDRSEIDHLKIFLINLTKNRFYLRYAPSKKLEFIPLIALLCGTPVIRQCWLFLLQVSIPSRRWRGKFVGSSVGDPVTMTVRGSSLGRGPCGRLPLLESRTPAQSRDGRKAKADSFTALPPISPAANRSANGTG